MASHEKDWILMAFMLLNKSRLQDFLEEVFFFFGISSGGRIFETN
jgi:hypothetical protein